MNKVGFDPSKLNKLRDNWMTQYIQTNQLLTQFQNNQVADRFNSSDTDDPMSKNGSVFKAEGTNGAGAAQNSSSTVNSGNQSTLYDSLTQQLPTGQNTIVTGSGTALQPSALKDPQSSDNQTGDADLAKKKEDAKQKLEEERKKYFSYLETALSYNPNASNSGSEVIFDQAGNTNLANNVTNNGSQAPQNNNSFATGTEGGNPTNTANKDDASDPSRTDMAYQKPDSEKTNEEQQLLKQEQIQQQLKQDQQNQQRLEEDARKIFKADLDAA